MFLSLSVAGARKWMLASSITLALHAGEFCTGTCLLIRSCFACMGIWALKPGPSPDVTSPLIQPCQSSWSNL